MNNSIRTEFDGYFFLNINQVSRLYNFSPKTLKRREKDGSIPLPPRIMMGGKPMYRKDQTFECLELLCNGAIK